MDTTETVIPSARVNPGGPMQVTAFMPEGEGKMFAKMPAGEARFTLRAQDASSDLITAAWVGVNLYMQERVKAGLSLDDVRQEVGRILHSAFPIDTAALDPKLSEALLTSKQMAQWGHRKLAD